MPLDGTRTFKFESNIVSDIDINLNPVQGDVELYVNPGFH
jgi:hypothetical protein